MFIRTPSYLSIEILKSRDANLHRAYSIWLLLRAKARDGKQCWFYLDDLLSEISELSGRTDRSVRRWINAGEDIFWIKHNGIISLIGKDTIYRHFNLERPGRIVMHDCSDLFKSLQSLRAHLALGWTNGRERAWASRETISGIIDKSHTTQIAYQKQTGQKTKEIFTDNMRNEKGWLKRLPNYYFRVGFTLTKCKKIYGAYSLEDKLQSSNYSSLKIGDKRQQILFTDKEKAIDESKGKLVFLETKFGVTALYS